MADGILTVESTESSNADVSNGRPQKARRRQLPNTEYAPGYVHTGAVILQVTI